MSSFEDLATFIIISIRISDPKCLFLLLADLLFSFSFINKLCTALIFAQPSIPLNEYVVFA